MQFIRKKNLFLPSVFVFVEEKEEVKNIHKDEGKQIKRECRPDANWYGIKIRHEISLIRCRNPSERHARNPTRAVLYTNTRQVQDSVEVKITRLALSTCWNRLSVVFGIRNMYMYKLYVLFFLKTRGGTRPTPAT